MYCRSCGKECLAEAIACTGCGVPPHKGNKFCQSCGEGTNDEAIMCVKCGGSLKKLSSFNTFTNDKKISIGAAVVMIISVLFLPWIRLSIGISFENSATIYGKPFPLLEGDGAIHALILAACAGASLFFNFKDDSEKSKYAALGAIGYVFALRFYVLNFNPNVEFAGFGVFLFVISAGASAYFAHKESN